DQALCSFSGLRPVVSEGDRPPSEESRDHVVWSDNGLITITGGKLTTFRRLAWDALKEAFRFISGPGTIDQTPPVFEPVRSVQRGDTVHEAITRRLFGRYGREASAMIAEASPEDMELLPGTNTPWIEVIQGAGEGIRHLDDLLLRRVRIGLLRADGGLELLDDIQKRCSPRMTWNRRRWREERIGYRNILESAYAVPGRAPRPAAVQEGLVAKGIRRVRESLGGGRETGKP
ncbi:glycerol-3-phosphate dehydrogenase C-terminal domain-containing protein, partial [Natronospira sp.]|uniref:glycerol-3-phosphate dehydrogenase C-terminal domain-containing protein n=1 Tax=Natronospira sp. TaxID=2024970 RepID=UPI003873AA55